MKSGRAALLVLLTLGMLVTPLVAPPAAKAQRTRDIPRVGIVASTSPASGRQTIDAFRRGLRDLGYIEGQSIIIEERWAEGQLERFGSLIADLVLGNVDVIVVGSVAGARAAKNTAMTVPVVFVAVTDPIGSGVVSNLARPGGNITGTSLVLGAELAAKWVDLVKDALPGVSSVAALAHTEHPMYRIYAQEIGAAARTLGLKVQVVNARDGAGLESSLAIMAKTPPAALIVTPSPLFSVHRKQIADFALSRGIPAIGFVRDLAVDGLLLLYGPSITDSYRRGAAYVDRILKGATPAEMPVEQPTEFELVINLKTAKTLGLTIPPSLLLRADHVIE